MRCKAELVHKLSTEATGEGQILAQFCMLEERIGQIIRAMLLSGIWNIMLYSEQKLFLPFLVNLYPTPIKH